MEDREAGPSAIIDCTGPEPVVIREGPKPYFIINQIIPMFENLTENWSVRSSCSEEGRLQK